MILRHVLATAFLLLASLAAGAARAEPRLALVIGQGAYAAGELPTAVNDAALVGQTLTSAGFEVVQGRDLNQGDLRRIIRDFLDGVQTATPDTTVVIYVAGHALQVEGEDYLVPTDARIARESDVPIEGYRVSDIIRSLSATPGATRLVDSRRGTGISAAARRTGPGARARDRRAAAELPRRVLGGARSRRAGRAGAVRRLRHRPRRDDARAGHRSGQSLRAGQASGARDHPRPADALARREPQCAVHVLRAGRGDGGSAGSRAPDRLRLGRGRLQLRGRAGHDPGLPGIPAGLSRPSACGPGQAAARGAARGGDLAADGAAQFA